MPSSVLGVGATVVIKRAKVCVLMGLVIFVGGIVVGGVYAKRRSRQYVSSACGLVYYYD